jgi:3-phenylpropionate/trans-cinnamate dioxygenase ferredoxin subunit
MGLWLVAARTGDFDAAPVQRFDLGDRTFALFRSEQGDYFATDGYCTHERAHLAEGLVIGHEIECPRHFGVFDYRTGEAVVAPACVDLRTYPTRVDGDLLLIEIDA